MSFLTENEMTNIYGYQIDQIADNDTAAIQFAIDAAIEEASTYLQNSDEIFNKVGDDRNTLVLKIVKTIAKWNFIEVCNVEILYKQAQERYDRALIILEKMRDNPLSVNDNSSLNLDELDPNISGSRRTKFKYE